MRLAVLFLMILFLSAPAFAQDSKIAGAVNECNPVLNGDWYCRRARSGKYWHLNLSLQTDGNGVPRLVQKNGACRGCYRNIRTYIADGRRHADEVGVSYAASCNHRTKTKGHKIFRIAYRLDAGKVGMEEYWIRSNGSMVIADFGGTMDGWDVRNSDRPATQPNWYSLCVKNNGEY